jgi:hypothetical protein
MQCHSLQRMVRVPHDGAVMPHLIIQVSQSSTEFCAVSAYVSRTLTAPEYPTCMRLYTWLGRVRHTQGTIPSQKRKYHRSTIEAKCIHRAVITV